jgi:hypothetical protein
MLSTFREILPAHVHDINTNLLRSKNSNVVVLGNLKPVQTVVTGWNVDKASASSPSRSHYTIDRAWEVVLDKFADDDPVAAFVKDLHRIGR